MKRIAYVTRSHDGGPQGKLNGGYSVARYFEMMELGIEHVQITGTAFMGEGMVPELNDFRNYGELFAIDWGQYDYVLFAEYAYAPFFWLSQIPSTMLVHSMWVSPFDETAHVLKKFLPWVKDVVVATLESKGLFTAVADATVHWLPYPVPEELFKSSVKWADRGIDVLWVGRAGTNKDAPAMWRIAEKLPGVGFVAYSANELHMPMLRNVKVHVAEPPGCCREAYKRAKVLLSTSRYETYSLVLVEAGLAGCAPVAREVWGIGHTVPGTLLFQGGVGEEEDAEVGAQAVRTALREGPRMPLEFWRKSYSLEAVKPRWKAFLDEKTR